MPIIAQMVQKSESVDFYIKVHAFLIFYGAQYIEVAGSGVKLGISPTYIMELRTNKICDI